MSVKLRFECPAEVGVVQRSRSFTGFSSLSGRRRVSSVQNSLRSKALSSKSPRMQPSPSRTGGGIWGHQPEQVDRIFQALRKGLKEYLEGHQAEMDFLSSQQRDTKRNSRLAFLYDLEKEIRALERYIRRLEFQISKVEELFETYCIQWRLCQGAVNMKKAFSLSPSSRASRESLLELNRNHRHSLEDMSVMEEELEILLGELHIKMKGLIGFARLCPGDQYEVVVRLGRQRWKIRGKIQTDDRQSWDEEEMIFLPHIHQNFEIKVTEAKGLGSLLVGMVTCKSADFFMARPQLMVVDITELGTIKLHLEVVWNPFESGEMRPITSAPSRLSIPSRKGSVYSWTAPNTPSFTQKYFISMVRQLQDPEGTFSMISGGSSRGVSLLNYLGDTSTSPTPTTAYSQAGSLTHISLVENEPTETPPLEGRNRGEEMGEEWPSSDQDTGPSSPSSTPGSLLALQRYSTPDILRQNIGLSDSPSSSPSPGPTMDTESPQVRSNETSQGPTVETRLGYEGPTVEEYEGPGEEVRLGYEDDYEKQHEQHHQAPATRQSAGSSSSQRRAVALRVSTLLAELEGLLQNQQCTEKELRALDNQILHLNTILKNDLSLLKKTSSDETLAVEEVLGSFDFLSTDFNADDDISCMGSIHLRNTGISSFQKNTLRSLGLLSQDSQSPEELDLAPLTTGNCSLDQALETHLGICTVLLEAMRSSESLLVQRDILEEMSLQAEVLEKVSRLMLEKTDMLSANDILPKAQRQRELLVFWEECTEGDSLFCCPVDTFAGTLRKRYIHKVKAKQPGQPYAVFSQLLLQIQAGCRMVPLPRCNQERVTVFQLSTYLSRWGLQDLGEHISCLSREVYLVSCLKSPKRRRTLKKLRGRRIAELLPLGSTLQLLAGLQTDGNHKVAQAAANCLCRAAGCKAFRAKAIVYYTEALRESEVQVQQAACLALKCLRATESVDQVAELWRSLDEDLRSAARETVLSFGKKGHIAFQKMDKIYCELQEEAYQNLDTEITIL